VHSSTSSICSRAGRLLENRVGWTALQPFERAELRDTTELKGLFSFAHIGGEWVCAQVSAMFSTTLSEAPVINMT
jgi:hypothetical protein